MVVLSHEHLDHIGAAYHFHGRAFIAAHRLAANKIMLRDDFSMLRKMFNEPNVPIDVDLWLEEGTSDRPRQFPPQRDVHAGPHLRLHHAVRAGQGSAVRRRHADARRRDGWRVRLGTHRRLHPVAGAAERPEFEDPAVRPWPAVRHAAGRRADRDPALAWLLSDTAQLFDALDARSNFEPIMQSVRDLNKLDDSPRARQRSTPLHAAIDGLLVLQRKLLGARTPRNDAGESALIKICPQTPSI